MFCARALLIIIKRASEEKYMSLLREHEMSSLFSVPGEGTAGSSILSVLGLGVTEKVVMLSLGSRRKVNRLLTEMVMSMGINMPGCGIAMSLPVTSIGGARAMKYLIGDIKEEDCEVGAMEEKQIYPYDLIMAIAEHGTSDLVMDAARGAGAGGGTIVHAKGTASTGSAKFFGISIANEKEMVLIAVRHEKKDAVMHAIMEKAGAASEAHTVVFTLPVENIVGLRSVMENMNSNP